MSMENLEKYLKEYLKLDKLPLYLRIYMGISDLADTIEVGRVYRLPPIRKLAKQLGVNNGTVARAYGKLEEEGIVYAKTGSGTYLRGKRAFQDCCPYKNSFIEKNIYKTDLYQNTNRFIDLAASTPTSDLFPVDSFKKAINHVLDRDGGKAFEYQEEKGFYPLRQSICKYIGDMGIKAEPEDILITTGAQQGIDLIAKALIETGDVVYTERPTYNGAAASFLSRGAILVDVPMDHEGIDPNILENMVKKKHPRFVYIMPNFQSPTGITYSIERRKEILDLAERYDFLLVEDDYLGELSFDDKLPLNHLKSFDKDDRVIYIKSFSKLFMPGLRLGFMVLPRPVQERFEKVKWFSDISTSALTQRAFDVYLRSGEWKVHLKQLKDTYSINHDTMVNALKAHGEIFEFTPPRGGLTLWVSVVGEKSSLEIAALAWKKGVKITPGYHFYVNGSDTQNIRLGYAAATPDEIEEGISKLVSSIK